MINEYVIAKDNIDILTSNLGREYNFIVVFEFLFSVYKINSEDYSKEPCLELLSYQGYDLEGNQFEHNEPIETLYTASKFDLKTSSISCIFKDKGKSTVSIGIEKDKCNLEIGINTTFLNTERKIQNIEGKDTIIESSTKNDIWIDSDEKTRYKIKMWNAKYAIMNICFIPDMIPVVRVFKISKQKMDLYFNAYDINVYPSTLLTEEFIGMHKIMKLRKVYDSRNINFSRKTTYTVSKSFEEEETKLCQKDFYKYLCDKYLGYVE